MKTVTIPIGKEKIHIRVSRKIDVLSLKRAKKLSGISDKTYDSLNAPIGTKPLSKLAKGCDSACIVVSDNTRPIPYKGEEGILLPIIETLQKKNVKNITVLIACGTHRPMTETEIRVMLGDNVFQDGIEVINHVASDKLMLRTIGSTERTPKVTINRHYLDADLKIATGLVEPHFMAGFSGGRKAICPGISGQDVTFGFHSAAILNNAHTTSLEIKKNPCHNEAVIIAKMAGVDFIVNITINSDNEITGIFSGDLIEAHKAAIEFLKDYVSINLKKQYDIVITQAGEVGVNHYQCAKAVVEASRAVKKGGRIILLANLTDKDPLGGENYKQMLRLLVKLGHNKFINRILSPSFVFILEQWQVQMWARVFEKLRSAENLFSCIPQLENTDPKFIPETNVASLVRRSPGESNLSYLKKMMMEILTSEVPDTDKTNILILPDGPYVVPIVNETNHLF